MTLPEKLITRPKSQAGHLKIATTLIAILVTISVALPVGAIFNCLTPNMFRMGKNGQYVPSAYGYPTPGYQQPYSTAGHNSFKKSLFQPKWRGGEGSLFGSKNLMPGWRNNFYRPAYGYGYGYGSGFMAPVSGAGYAPVNEQLNVAPFNVPSAVSSYAQQSAHHNNPQDGWSAPLTSSYTNPPILSPSGQYDNYLTPSLSNYNSQNNRPSQITSDPYGTKGSSGRLSSTKNNILLADGGYDLYDAHLVQSGALKSVKNQTFGYTYPNWYSSGYNSFDSPGRIAQQLFKSGMKRQRLEMFNNRSAPLVAFNQKFTILDEPRFVGFGSVQLSNSKEARLSCSFNEAIDETNRPLWVKFTGPYNSSRILDSKPHPTFNCENDQCRTQEIEAKKNFRYRFDNGPAISTLIISDARLSDYGIYRCSALTKTVNNNPLETIYQIVKFGEEA